MPVVNRIADFAAGLHHPQYDFNDAVAPAGASFFARRLVERAQPLHDTGG